MHPFSDEKISAIGRGVRVLLVGALLATGLAQSTKAQTFISDTGSLATSTSTFEQSFALSSTSTIDIETWGFGGGTNAAGQVIPAGGFDSLVALFSGSGPTASIVLVGGNPAASGDTLTSFSPNCPPSGFVTIGTGMGASVCGDNNLLLAGLAAGTYTLVLTDANYIPNAVNPGPPGASTIGDGFTDFTGGVFQTCNFPSGGMACITPTSNFAMDIVDESGPTLSPTPEPASFVLGGTGLVALVLRKRSLSRRPKSGTV
jgi:hypothetical protein